MDRRAALAVGGIAAATVAAGGIWLALKPRSADAKDSIAVLPFANLSGDPTQTYFSDGIAEELRSALARFSGLKVVGRTSSEAVRKDDAETAARKLAVSNILTGSVRQSPATIRISAQLIDGQSGMERWSQDYDRQPGDAIKIQTDIAGNVARALSITLGTAGRSAIAAGATENADAQRLLLQAIEATRLGGKNDLLQGISLADAAIKTDPEYGEAYAYKALFTIFYASTFAADIPELFRMRDQAVEIARTALRIAPESATGHRAMAEIYRALLNLRTAQREFRRALELAPNDVGSVTGYAFLTGVSSDSAEGIRLADRAVELDPLNIDPYGVKFVILLSARRFADGINFSRGIERNKPHLFNWPEGVAYALICMGKLDEAESYQRRADPDSYNRLVNEAAIYARTGRLDQVPAVISKIRSVYGEAASFQYGQIYAQLGDRERAFAALQRAWEIRDAGLTRLKTDPYIDPLRTDPRYAWLMKKLNYPA